VRGRIKRRARVTERRHAAKRFPEMAQHRYGKIVAKTVQGGKVIIELLCGDESITSPDNMIHSNQGWFGGEKIRGIQGVSVRMGRDTLRFYGKNGRYLHFCKVYFPSLTPHIKIVFQMRK